MTVPPVVVRLCSATRCWEVIQVFIAEGRDLQEAADNLGVRRGLVDAAVAYYADNQDAIDDRIEANRMMMDEAAASFDRQQAIKAGLRLLLDEQLDLALRSS